MTVQSALEFLTKIGIHPVTSPKAFQEYIRKHPDKTPEKPLNLANFHPHDWMPCKCHRYHNKYTGKKITYEEYQRLKTLKMTNFYDKTPKGE